MGSFDRLLVQVRDGEIDFGRFVMGTRDDYRRMTKYLMGRWSTPEWFVEEDVEQELYLETWRVVWKHDPTRGVSLKRFVMFNAIVAAKRAMHKARGVTISGSPDKKTSCFETPITRIEEVRMRGNVRVGEVTEKYLHAEDPEIEAMMDAEEVREAAMAALEACNNPRERGVVLAIAQAGSLDNAPRVLYDDIRQRVAFRLGSEEKAERFVREHATAVAGRIHEARVNPG